jgi:hypothetical protein
MRTRDEFVLTPIQYAKEVEDALTTSKLKCTVDDIFVVPDYCAFIDLYTDKKFRR